MTPESTEPRPSARIDTALLNAIWHTLSVPLAEAKAAVPLIRDHLARDGYTIAPTELRAAAHHVYDMMETATLEWLSDESDPRTHDQVLDDALKASGYGLTITTTDAASAAGLVMISVHDLAVVKAALVAADLQTPPERQRTKKALANAFDIIAAAESAEASGEPST